MSRRSSALLILVGAATTAQPTFPLLARAFGCTRILMPPSTRHRRLTPVSPTPVTSLCVAGDKSRTIHNDSNHSEPSMVAAPMTPVALPADPLACRTLLQSWANHSLAGDYNFAPDEATGIRSSLLEWYTKNRRKLPWRGDPPPFNGSTSGINSSSSDSNKKKRGRTMDQDSPAAAGKKNKPGRGKQASIASFFTATPSTKRTKVPDRSKIGKVHQEEKPTKQESLLDQAIPVTGYGVWVSEIMLQQTRVEAVIPFWIKWMKSFPTVYELAAATEDEVNSHWAGLGFYRRARYLHQGAKYVVQELDGALPTTPQELSKIAGIGPYTASAIASIAFGVCVPVVDGNVCRVLSRLKGIPTHIKNPILKDKLGWKLAAQIVEAGDGSSPGLVNQALMELGATYCAPAGSGVDERDPLKDYYLSTKLGRAYLLALKDGGIDDLLESETSKTTTSSRKNKRGSDLGDPDGIQGVIEKLRESITPGVTTMEEAAKIGHSVFPTDPPKTEKREEDLAMAVILNRSKNAKVGNASDNIRYLMVRRPREGLLAGQWEFPNICARVRKKTGKKSDSKNLKKRECNQALTKFLQELLLAHPNDELGIALSKLSRKFEKEPLEHVFSHVKHYMWVEVGSVTNIHLDPDDLEWVTSSGKEVRWMNQQDMKDVGITSGVKKVLKSVKKS